MPLTLSQSKRPLRATTPLGGNVLIPVSVTGEEELSRPFLFTVDFTSTKSTVAAADLLGKAITLHLPLGDGSEERLIHGLVRRFTQMGQQRTLSRFRVELVPALWFLTLSSDCRTFENMSLLDVVEKVCKSAGVTDFKRRITAAPSPIPYVVQYRESDFAFVSRLLEEAGLYYTFEHTAGAHTLVFSDSFDASVPAGKVPVLKVNANEVAGQVEPDTVQGLTREFVVHTETMSVLEHDLLETLSLGNSNAVSTAARGTAFDFTGDVPPRPSAIETVLRIEAEEAVFDTVRAESGTPAIQSGTSITLKNGPFGAAGQHFHILRVEHEGETSDVTAASGQEARYGNRFTAIPVSTRFRPRRTTPRPSVRGTQTAKIVGTGGDGEIDVDAEGRVLLEFPWDRGDGAEGKSKHRVHLASVWAGTGWGFVQLPRIGQEVLVEYLEGDPARPIVTGRVYNSTHKVPYTLPANKTQSGWKSRTLKGEESNFNEMRFDDKKGEEHISVQAEKDLKTLVKHDETRAVQNDRTTVISNNDTRTVGGKDKDGTEIGGNDTITVKKGNRTITVDSGNLSTTVSKGDETREITQGKQTTKIFGDQTLTVQTGNRKATIQQGNDALEVSIGNLTTDVKIGNISVKADLGKITVEAMQSIELKVMGNSIKIDPTGITMKGLMINIEAQTMATFKGLMVTVQGQAMTQIKAPMTMVNGDGMLMLKGGITMIN